MPDEFKRVVILRMFNINAVEAGIKYEMAIKNMVPEELDMARESKEGMKFLGIHCLNETGQLALETILSILYKQFPLEYTPILVQVLSLLLIYLAPGEAFIII